MGKRPRVGTFFVPTKFSNATNGPPPPHQDKIPVTATGKEPSGQVHKTRTIVENLLRRTEQTLCTYLYLHNKLPLTICTRVSSVLNFDPIKTHAVRTPRKNVVSCSKKYESRRFRTSRDYRDRRRKRVRYILCRCS